MTSHLRIVEPLVGSHSELRKIFAGHDALVICSGANEKGERKVNVHCFSPVAALQIKAKSWTYKDKILNLVQTDCFKPKNCQNCRKAPGKMNTADAAKTCDPVSTQEYFLIIQDSSAHKIFETTRDFLCPS